MAFQRAGFGLIALFATTCAFPSKKVRKYKIEKNSFGIEDAVGAADTPDILPPSLGGAKVQFRVAAGEGGRSIRNRLDSYQSPGYKNGKRERGGSLKYGRLLTGKEGREEGREAFYDCSIIAEIYLQGAVQIVISLLYYLINMIYFYFTVYRTSCARSRRF